ncbi:MAG TPA: NYN domain-containing protein [Candidatus Aminicenantes bacterium]|nr:NYN domain-containing protein [Candidatus Aminicenantes bacterium]HRY64959.1 NYN domain-containing protein [Candidatus Aminicenantes bacterium]HRZ71872.1 NYN domain-containing protein [Candidatus Aminicenantes bacterium]
MAEPFIEEKTRKIALLIDGDNAQPSLIGQILTEAGKYGLVTIRRIYGDWTTVNMSGWKNALNDNAIQPIQQFRYTIGKNATDSAMIIDAMDILHGHLVDGFCLVSSDSDYTRLATRVREMGFFVMGVGKRSTPKAFVNGCNLFIYTENLTPKRGERETRRRDRGGAGRKGGGKETREPKEEREEPEERAEAAGKFDPVPLLKGAFDMAVHEDGWANLGEIGFYLRQLDPGFDPRTYGFKQLSQLINSQKSLFDIHSRDDESGGGSAIYIRLREKPE